MSKHDWRIPLDDDLQPYQTDAINRVTATQISDLKKISSLRMSHEWKEALSNIHLNRGFKKMDGEMLRKMGTIGASESDALLYLATEGKRVGVELLYKIEIELNDEMAIQDVVNLILKHGVKESRIAVDLILASGEPISNLFSRRKK